MQNLCFSMRIYAILHESCVNVTYLLYLDQNVLSQGSNDGNSLECAICTEVMLSYGHLVRTRPLQLQQLIHSVI